MTTPCAASSRRRRRALGLLRGRCPPPPRTGAGGRRRPNSRSRSRRCCDWSFAGLFGKYDPAQLQRGFQVYKEVCSTCHSMNLVAFRNLADEGGPHFTEDEVKALAATYQITDGPNDAGDMFQRPGKPVRPFPGPFPNPEAAAAANGGAAPPDLSLIAKARASSAGLLWAAARFLHRLPGGRARTTSTPS